VNAAELVPEYIAAGLPVFPCRGKLPAIRTAHPEGDPARGRCRGECGRLGHGLYDATTDPGQVAEWLAEFPRANWAVRPPVGLVVLDVDPRHGGARQLAELTQRHGRLPATLTARTGGGGLHVWLGYRGPLRGQLCPGVDLKGPGGYVIVPPSVHPETSRPYVWLDPDATTAPAPAWLRTMLAPPRAPRAATRTAVPGDRKLAGLVRTVTEAQPGSRNQRLFWAACRAVEAGLDVAPLIAEAIGAGLPAAEAERTAASATRRLETTR
jgi:Bifunctional DNA primase/polymerase, N-terminal